MKKRTRIYYNYNGLDVTFAFDEGFNGRIQGPDHSGLTCSVLNNENDATIIYVTEGVGGNELFRIVMDK